MAQEAYARLPSSGIKVLIVGAGFAGLCAAIECDRKGHRVTLLEKVAALKPLGDIISFASNSGRIFERWEGVVEALEPIIHKSEGLNFHSWEGEFMTRQIWEADAMYGRRINGHRAEIHRVVYEHALARGIDVRLGQNVTEYWETESDAGVVSNGERISADCVLAAEGVKSKARKIVLGYEDRPKASGYAVYRAWMSTEALAKNPSTKWFCHGDTHNGWVGEDKHFLVASIKGGKELSWVLTHKDDGDIDEDWSFPGSKDDVLACLQSWDPVLHDLVKATPEDRLHDYKLVFRDPLPTFISPQARIALIGDAAHPFLPTSIQGASQSMEDGVALAITLEKSGKHNVQQAVRVYEAVRYARVHRAQMTGVTTREQWHKADWDKIRQGSLTFNIRMSRDWSLTLQTDPKSLHLRREPWLLDFDQEAYTYAHFDDAVAKLKEDGAATVAIPVATTVGEKSAAPQVLQTEVVGAGQG
jgi:2-polyprenyl-6-methoxyphenol hydroxylase-like FAD-dependent oxidoreductase